MVGNTKRASLQLRDGGQLPSHARPELRRWDEAFASASGVVLRIPDDRGDRYLHLVGNERMWMAAMADMNGNLTIDDIARVNGLSPLKVANLVRNLYGEGAVRLHGIDVQ